MIKNLIRRIRANKPLWFAGVLLGILAIVLLGSGLVGLITICIGIVVLAVLGRIKGIDDFAPLTGDPHVCNECGFDLAGLDAQVQCPECGWVRTAMPASKVGQ